MDCVTSLPSEFLSEKQKAKEDDVWKWEIRVRYCPTLIPSDGDMILYLNSESLL